jgi:beta-lactamase class D
MVITRELMYLETSPRGLRLYGKTGSNFYDEARTYQLGWFVGHIGNDSEGFIFVSNLTDLEPFLQKGVFGGPRAKEFTIDVLKRRDLW